MRRVAGVAFAVVAVAGGLAVGPAGEAVAAERSVCVRVHGACFATVQAAVNAAHRGDTVHIPAGRFPGGVVVTKSITLAGAGAGRTVLAGGEHVLTVGTFDAAHEPTVRITRVTLTGGRAQSGPESVPFTGLDQAIASGAGLLIMPGKDFGPGATVTVTDSVISNNRVSPTEGPFQTRTRRSTGRAARTGSAPSRALPAVGSTTGVTSPWSGPRCEATLRAARRPPTSTAPGS